MSVLCSYYCLYYINESSRQKDYYDIIKPFSQTGTNHNEKLIKHYFKNMQSYVYMGAFNGDSYIKENLKGNDGEQGREGPPGSAGP